MIDLNNIKYKLLENKNYLFNKYKIKLIAIFGSVSRNEHTENSNLDIMVEFVQPIGIEFINLANELEKILNTKVDLVSRNGIKDKYFNEI